VDGDPGGDLPGVVEVVGEARLGGGVGHRDGVGLVEGGATVDLLGALGDLAEGLVDTGVRDDGVDHLDPHGSLRGVGHGEGDTAGVAVGRGHGGGGGGGRQGAPPLFISHHFISRTSIVSKHFKPRF